VLRSRTLDLEAVETARLEGTRLRRSDPLWPGQLALFVAVALGFALPDKVTVGPRWVLTAVEAVALAGLIAATPHRDPRHSARRRNVALALLGVVSATYVAELGLLVHHLVQGGKTNGHPLIIAGTMLWGTNVLVFAVMYWQVDRGGPLPHPASMPEPDFLFPQMTDDARPYAPGWHPGFIDYLYVSLTNATAFSPTDTMPLTPRAKICMATQSIAALLTIGLVVARAVNILS
jgi:uncharacterized membrane protein